MVNPMMPLPAFTPSSTEILFWEALALIIAACIFAPLLRRLGLGTVLGYLTAGIIIKITLSASFVDHPEELLHFAEFGVVLFLFVIGLELRPASLWAMRTDIFGLGLFQLLGCGALLFGLASLYGLGWKAGLIAGLGLALSSTALVMQALDEKKERATTYGRKAFSVLLFQDLAIVPLLLIAAILAPATNTEASPSALAQFTFSILAILGLIFSGRYILNPMFRILARARMQEVMTAAALGVVIFAALIMDLAGMSYAMGSFLAGVMLADSDYRHELEANVEPFRGLFLGLFFMAVGISLDFNAIRENWLLILLAAPMVMILKTAGLYAIARGLKHPHIVALKTSMALGQAGEFGFVLFGAATTSALLTANQGSTLIAIVTVTMALSPLFTRLESLFIKPVSRPEPVETYEDATGRVLIIGFGRFGQIVSQPLLAQGIDVTILDSDPDRIAEAATFGFRIHYGDGMRRDVLKAAGAQNARLIVICVGDPARTNMMLTSIRTNFPEARIFARSRDRQHSIELARREIDYSLRETFESALKMGAESLLELDFDDRTVHSTIDDIRTRDIDRLKAQIAGDLHAGKDRLYVKPTKTEPATSVAGEANVKIESDA